MTLTEKMDRIGEIEDFIANSWKKVLTEVRNAAVYIDHAAAECLHWHTAGKGYLTLKQSGAVAVHELGMYHFRYAEVTGTKKAVIISTSGKPAFYQRTLKMIFAKNAFESCTILCTVPSNSFDQASSSPSEDTLDYAKLEKDVRSWMSSKNPSQESSVKIVYVQLSVASLTEDLFVTPPFGNLMPSLNGEISQDDARELDFLANSLHNLFESVNARLDVYSIGTFSERLAENLENLIAKNVLGSPETGVTLILVDRTMDLCTPTSNNTESFLAKVLCTLPHLLGHSNDVEINMSPIFQQVEGVLRAHRVPGCLAGAGRGTVDQLISKTPKKVLAATNQSLNDMFATKESPKPKTPARISGHSLEKFLSKLRATNSFDSANLDSREKLQSILAVIEASNSEKTAKLELLTSLEILALQNLSVSRQSSSILAQLSNIIRTRATRGLDMENLLPLLINVYALAGTQIQFSGQQEGRLEESIAEAVFEDIKILQKNSSTVKTPSIYQRALMGLPIHDDEKARDTSIKISVHVMNVLRAVANQRSSLHDYSSLMVKPISRETVRHVGVLEQLATDILRPDASSELRDLRQKSSSLISAGLNLFLKGRTRHHPRDNRWIWIYVIGGVCAEEAKVLREVASIYNNEATRTRVTLAGSRLLNPLDVADKFLLSSVNH